MNKKAESVQFVVIVAAAFVVIGLFVVAFGKNTTITSKATYAPKTCYSIEQGKLVPAEITYCCAIIKKSEGCRPHQIDAIADELYACDSVLVNRNTIAFCEG
jgi:hypothetical protein